MKLLVVVVAAFLSSGCLRADAPLPRPVGEAYQLWRSGHSAAAIAQLEPFLQTDPSMPDEQGRGIAWTILGSSYLDVERFPDARRAYERALAILKPLPDGRKQYASALDSLGTLEQSLGHTQTARSLCSKAQHVYEELGNHYGLAITATNLANIAFVEADFKTARRFVARATEEKQLTTGMREDDIAALDVVRSAVALHDGKTEEAMTAVQEAISLWERAYGRDYFMLPDGYLLLAQVLAKSGDRARAMDDAGQGLARAEALWGKNSIGYLSAEAAYARVLRLCGEKKEARRLANESSHALAVLEQQQCGGCTVNANSFY
jgi:tetratricopeptide (TPR) repeat protein